MSLDTLSAGLLGYMLTRKGVIRREDGNYSNWLRNE